MMTKLECTTNIPENTLHKSKVRHARGMHMKTNLLHGIGDIWLHQSEILKHTSKTLVFSAIRSNSPLASESLD
jgi:hypothetical protein